MIYKMLVCNIDGTLLLDNGRMNKITREALDFARKKGVTVVLATSRNFHAAKRIAKSFHLDAPIVAHQGAFIAEDWNKPVYVKRINEQTASELVTLLENFSCQLKLVHEKFSIGNKVDLPDQMMARVLFHTTNRFSYQEKFVDQVSEWLRDDPVSPPKMEITFGSKSDKEEAMETIAMMFDEVQCIELDELNVDIVPAEVSKVSGVQYICERMGVKREEVVAIGSGIDDLQLISWAGLGVAMKNAPTELHEAADWITRSNNDNGVAYMVKEHFRRQYKLGFPQNMKPVK